MALKKNTHTDFDVEIIDAYHRVELLGLNTKEQITFRVRSYVADKTDRYFSDQVVTCNYNLNGENPIKQAYLYLKTLPEFADAEDC